MQDIKVGLIGFGTVGQGLAETLHSQENRLTKRTGMKIGIKTIANTRARALPAHLEHIHLTQDARDILADPEIDIVVELIETGAGYIPCRRGVVRTARGGVRCI